MTQRALAQGQRVTQLRRVQRTIKRWKFRGRDVETVVGSDGGYKRGDRDRHDERQAERENELLEPHISRRQGEDDGDSEQWPFDQAVTPQEQIRQPAMIVDVFREQ